MFLLFTAVVGLDGGDGDIIAQSNSRVESDPLHHCSLSLASDMISR